MSTENNTVCVEFYNLPLTGRADDRFGRVVSSQSLTEDDLIQIAVQRRSGLNPTTMRASLDVLKEIAIEKIGDGAWVQFGLSYYGLEPKGVFTGNNPIWDSAIHSLHIKTMPIAALTRILKFIKVKTMGMANSGTIINYAKDMTSGEVNTQLTPGGGVNLDGRKIKIVGTSPDNGIRIINQANGETIRIEPHAVLTNQPKKVSFIVPVSLPSGDYKLSVTTQYGGSSSLLKEPRTFILDYLFTVI